MKGVLFDNEGTCVFSSFPLDTRDIYTRTLFILVTVQDPFPIVTLQDVYTITRRLFVVPERGGHLPRPLVYLQTTYGMGLSNGMALRL